MPATKLKKGNEKTVVGFNNSSLPLGERDDLEKLAEIAVRSGDQSLLDLFESVPTKKELDKAKSAKFLAETSNVDNKDGDSGQNTNTNAGTSEK